MSGRKCAAHSIGKMKNRSLHIIMLAGGMRASAFRESLGIPTLCLPIGCRYTLLDAWLASFSTLKIECDIRIVVSQEEDVEHLERLASSRRHGRQNHRPVSIMKDPSPWRGTGGLLRDVTEGLDDPALVMIVESSCVPPVSLEPILMALGIDHTGLVGCSSDCEPCGVYVFRASAFRVIPPEGFCDLKEQGLPLMYARGERLVPCTLVDRVRRIRDRETCLEFVRSRMYMNVGRPHSPWIDPEADVASSARILGCSVLEQDVRIEDGAVVQDSLLFKGAIVRRGAVVSRSILGEGVVVQADSTVRDETVPLRKIVFGDGQLNRIRPMAKAKSMIRLR